MFTAKNIVRVAIDGPVSSGKSSVGSRVAEELHYLFVDTGLMYRALAYKILQHNIVDDAWENTAQNSTFEWRGDSSHPNLFLDGMDLTGKLFSPDLAAFTSKVAAHPQVRKILESIQRQMARDGIVMVGRDIGTVVLPDAELKIFLSASQTVRVERRYQELCSMGVPVDREKLMQEISERDNRDSTRSDSPLRLAPGGVELDTTYLTLNEVVAKIVSMARAHEALRK